MSWRKIEIVEIVVFWIVLKEKKREKRKVTCNLDRGKIKGAGFILEK